MGSFQPALFQVTEHRVVQLDTPDEMEATGWWDELTGNGGEGMVVKPMAFIATGKRGLAQPAMKCRGVEYLRIIYGPEYTLPENIKRLRNRSLSNRDCPDQTDSSNHVTLWDGSNYKRAA